MTITATRFTGKVAIVTGAAQGIGFEAAKLMGLEGASIVVADAAETPALEAVEQFQAMGITAQAAVFNLSTLAGAEAAVQVAVSQFGSADILVNNVGGAIWMKPFWQFTEDEMKAEVDRTLWPTLMCCRAVIDVFRAAGSGVIVNVGSNAAVDGVYRIPYSACKGGVNSLTRSLAVELAPLNIRVNCVSPGGTLAPERKTPRGAEQNEQEQAWMNEFIQLVKGEELLSEYASAEDQAKVIAFLASDDAKHMTGEILETGRRGLRISERLGYVPA